MELNKEKYPSPPGHRIMKEVQSRHLGLTSIRSACGARKAKKITNKYRAGREMTRGQGGSGECTPPGAGGEGDA